MTQEEIKEIRKGKTCEESVYKKDSRHQLILKPNGYYKSSSSFTQNFICKVTEEEILFAPKGINLIIEGLLDGRIQIMDGYLVGRFIRKKMGHVYRWELTV